MLDYIYTKGNKMDKGEMLEKLADYYASQFGADGIHAYAGSLSVIVTEEQLQQLLNLKGIK